MAKEEKKMPPELDPSDDSFSSDAEKSLQENNKPCSVLSLNAFLTIFHISVLPLPPSVAIVSNLFKILILYTIITEM